MAISKITAALVVASQLMVGTFAAPTEVLKSPVAVNQTLIDHDTLACSNADLGVYQSDLVVVMADYASFCNSKDSGTSFFSETHGPISSAGIFYKFTITNIYCDTAYIEEPYCSETFDLISNTCWNSDGKNTGGLQSYSCGHYSLLFTTTNTDQMLETLEAALETKEDAIDEKRKTSDVSTCEGYSSSGSPCNPPDWTGCTDSEARCILDGACDFMQCLKTGVCYSCAAARAIPDSVPSTVVPGDTASAHPDALMRS